MPLVEANGSQPVGQMLRVEDEVGPPFELMYVLSHLRHLVSIIELLGADGKHSIQEVN
jgi:hypothetical protein